MRRTLLLLCLCSAGCAGLAQSNSEPESPQRLVRLNVAAIAANGDPVTDLQMADVQVREGGKPVPIAFFRFDGSSRGRRAEPFQSPVEFTNFTNQPGPAPLVILLDRWNERMLTAARASNSLSTALEHIESVDRIYIYFLTNHGELLPVRAIPHHGADERQVPELSPQELRAKLDQVARSQQGFRDIDAIDPLLSATKTFQAVSSLCTDLAAIAGRKNLIWVTRGMPLTAILPQSRGRADFTPQIRNLSAAAVQSQIAIYTVDESSVGNVASLARQTLQMFSSLTGGRWYPSDDAAHAIADSLADARGNYRVAYYSAIHDKDRKEHKIQLESARKGVHLLSYEGYAGDAPGLDPKAVQDALFNGARSSPFDATEIGLRVSMSRNPPAGMVHFEIRLDPADILMERQGERYQGDLGVMCALYGEGQASQTSPPLHVQIHLTQEELNQAAKDGIVIPQDVPVAGQTQSVRVMVFDRKLWGLGSVTVPLR